MTRTADVVIVGGGFAGAATAYHLSRRGFKKVLLLEREDLPGRHASGNNAAVARCLVVTPDHLPLSIEGIRFMQEPPDDFPAGTYFRRTGSMMLAGPELEESVRASVAASQSAGVAGEWLTAVEVQRLVPVTSGGTFVGGAYGRDDGIADVAALLAAYLRVARAGGLDVLSGECVSAIETRHGAVTGVRTSGGDISTPVVVNAAGAWAPEVARLAGVSALPLRSLRRHLMITSELPWVDRSWPAVWDMSHEVYFRPEPPGLLLSPCDASESEDTGAGTDRSALELLAEKLTRWFPRLEGISVAKQWAGLRTLTSDGNPILGADPCLKGFFWCAGLGGNGMTLSPALGRLTAEAVLGREPPVAFAARRFVSQ